MAIRKYKNDLPNLDNYAATIAVDTETLGLNHHRDRLCVIQLSPGDGSADIIQIDKGQTQAPNLVKLLTDPDRLKLFHFARFDLGILQKTFNIEVNPSYCTKIASKLVRTYTDKHSLKELARELIGVDMSKIQQSSDWGADDLTDSQISYAASDVLYLHDIRRQLDRMLERENRTELAQKCFEFLPQRVKLDLLGWSEIDIFAHI